MKPSSRPISSSCSKWPRLEKNRLPGSRQMLWRRPLLSVSRTHSPARSGPRWTPDQASGATSVEHARHPRRAPRSRLSGAVLAERLVDVGGGRARRRSSRRPRPGGTPCAGVRLIARIRSSPTIVDRAARVPRSRVRATVETATHGRRSSGVASSAASLTTPIGRAGAGDGHDAAGLGLLRAAYGLGERQVVGDGEGTPGQVAGHQGGQPAPEPGRRHGGGGAGPEEQRDDEREDEVDDVGLRRRASRSMQQRPAQDRDGGDPAAPAGDDGAAVGVCRSTPQTPALSTRPPSSGSPGTRLRTPTSRLAPARPSTASRSSPSGVTNQRPQRAPRRPRSR